MSAITENIATAEIVSLYSDPSLENLVDDVNRSVLSALDKTLDALTLRTTLRAKADVIAFYGSKLRDSARNVRSIL